MLMMAAVVCTQIAMVIMATFNNLCLYEWYALYICFMCKVSNFSISISSFPFNFLHLLVEELKESWDCCLWSSMNNVSDVALFQSQISGLIINRVMCRSRQSEKPRRSKANQRISPLKIHIHFNIWVQFSFHCTVYLCNFHTLCTEKDS